MKVSYKSGCVTKGELPIVIQANRIIREFQNAGYRLTLRQLFYQFVSRNYMENTRQNYQKLCGAIKNGRLAGMIDWATIEDRTRNLRCRSRWNGPRAIVESCADQYHGDFWQDQDDRVEVWFEKDAVIGVVEATCRRWDCPYTSCRGYSSTSEMREAAMRIENARKKKKGFVILYCGDHDPSGVNMGDYIVQALRDFGAVVDFERIALNMDQIQYYSLPPNRVKETDSRSKIYRRCYGEECWELDALPPQVLNMAVEEGIKSRISDMGVFEERRAEDDEGRRRLQALADRFDEALRHIEAN